MGLGSARLKVSRVHLFPWHLDTFLVILVDFFSVYPCIIPRMARTPVVSSHLEETKGRGLPFVGGSSMNAWSSALGWVMSQSRVSGLEGKATWVT